MEGKSNFVDIVGKVEINVQLKQSSDYIFNAKRN